MVLGGQKDAWATELHHRLPAEAVGFLDGAFAVYLLAVAPDQQGQGLGGQLLEAVLAEAARGAWLLTTDVESPALRFYKKRG